MARPCFKPLPPPSGAAREACWADALRVGVVSASTGSTFLGGSAGFAGAGVSAGSVRRVCRCSAGRNPAASGSATATGPRFWRDAASTCSRAWAASRASRLSRSRRAASSAASLRSASAFLRASSARRCASARFLASSAARRASSTRRASSAFLRASSALRASSICLAIAASRSVIRRDRRWSSRPSLLASARWAAICPSSCASSVARSFCWPTSAVFCSDVSATTFSISLRRASARVCSAARRSMSARSACTALARAWDT
ncbi:hypothetical protein G6F22_014776 [Rhizopus arrhizus]|nr:hypothetical protein G6F22_014776 [Rhizopus arrhizus]